MDMSLYRTDESIAEKGRDAAEALIEHNKERGRACSDKIGGRNGTLRYLGTVSSAHDIAYISRALAEERTREGKISKPGLFVWAQSYGAKLAYAALVKHKDLFNGLILECKCPCPRESLEYFTNRAPATASFRTSQNYTRIHIEKTSELNAALTSVLDSCQKGNACPVFKSPMERMTISEKFDIWLENLSKYRYQYGESARGKASYTTFRYFALALTTALYRPQERFGKLLRDLQFANTVRRLPRLLSLGSILTEEQVLKRSSERQKNDFLHLIDAPPPNTPLVGAAFDETTSNINCMDVRDLGELSFTVEGLLRVYDEARRMVGKIAAEVTAHNWAYCAGYRREDQPTEPFPDPGKLLPKVLQSLRNS